VTLAQFLHKNPFVQVTLDFIWSPSGEKFSPKENVVTHIIKYTANFNGGFVHTNFFIKNIYSHNMKIYDLFVVAIKWGALALQTL
jgi:hypothetical protein